MVTDDTFSGYKSFIMKKYATWLTRQGAKVVALPVDADFETIKSTILKIQGVLFPGGSELSDEYIAFSTKVFDFVKEQNDAGTPIAMWGTCLGF